MYETPLVEADATNVPQRNAVAFHFDVPLAQLKPGNYICQVNVIDDAGGSFSFPRTALRVQAAATPVSTPIDCPCCNTVRHSACGNGSANAVNQEESC